MIDNITYEDFESIITLLNNSNNNLINILNNLESSGNDKTLKMKRFTEELSTYISFLNNTLTINKDADEAIKKIRELNN